MRKYHSIYIEDSLLDRTKKVAKEIGISLNSYIVDLIEVNVSEYESDTKGDVVSSLSTYSPIGKVAQERNKT